MSNWRKERTQDWYHEYQLSGAEAGWGGSQHETPRMRGEELVAELLLCSGGRVTSSVFPLGAVAAAASAVAVVVVSFAT